MMTKRIREAGVRGMLPYRRDSIKLSFGDYIDRSKLPKLPKGPWGHIGNKPPQPWQHWYDNDRVGCCVCSGAEHETAVFAAATKRPMPTFVHTNLENYSAMLVNQGGDPYNPNDPSTDAGLDPTAAASYRYRVGLKDDNGTIHRVDAYAVISNVDDLVLATYIFGVAGLGLMLPDSAEQQFVKHHVWDDLHGTVAGGHYPPCVGLNRHGNLVLSTWNDVQGATKEYVEKYWSVGIAYLSKEYLMASGKSPELIAWDDLKADLDALT